MSILHAGKTGGHLSAPLGAAPVSGVRPSGEDRGHSTDTAEKAVRALLEDYPTATMLDARGKSIAQAASIDQFANSIYVLLALALFIALIGISTTLALSVVEQTRDIGLLRAVGATAKQTGQMVRWESLLIGQILVIIALAATAAVVAAAGPARRASRLRLLTALVKP